MGLWTGLRKVACSGRRKLFWEWIKTFHFLMCSNGWSMDFKSRCIFFIFPKILPPRNSQFWGDPTATSHAKKLLFCIFIFLQRPPPPHASADKFVITCKVKPLFWVSFLRIKTLFTLISEYDAFYSTKVLLLSRRLPPKGDSQEFKTKSQLSNL